MAGAHDLNVISDRVNCPPEKEEPSGVMPKNDPGGRSSIIMDRAGVFLEPRHPNRIVGPWPRRGTATGAIVVRIASGEPGGGIGAGPILCASRRGTGGLNFVESTSEGNGRNEEESEVPKLGDQALARSARLKLSCCLHGGRAHCFLRHDSPRRATRKRRRCFRALPRFQLFTPPWVRFRFD